MKKLALAALLASVVAAPAFAEPAKEAAPATKMEAAKPAAGTVAKELKDGTKIQITGEKVEVLGKDGKTTPAPDGTHELKDGSKVETKGGMIVKH